MSDKQSVAGERGMYTRPGGDGRLYYWARVWINAEQRSRHFKLGHKLKAAKERLHQIKGDPAAALVERDRVAPQRLPFPALVKRFLSEYHSKGGTDFYLQVSKSWVAYFGKVDADILDRHRVERYRDHLTAKGYSISTVRKYVGALGTMYRWGIEQGIVQQNPTTGVKRPFQPSRLVAVLNHDEEKQLLGAASPETRIAIELYIASGMRRGEGIDLEWSQIDRANGAILIHKSKTGKARTIPLNDRLSAILDRCVRHIHSEHALTTSGGHRLDERNLTRHLESAIERGGLTKHQGAAFNLLRHTFGSRMAEAGVDMTTLATIMGNSPDVCFKHYIRFSPGHLKAAMATQNLPPTDPRAKNVVELTVGESA